MDRCRPNIEGLINKYLDGEITARELEDLRQVIHSDPAAAGLFEQMQQVDRYCQEAISRYVLNSGRPVEDLLAGLWPTHRLSLLAERFRQVLHARFAVGLAAGLILGLSAAFVWLWLQRPVGPDQNGPERGPLVEEEVLPRINLYYYRDSQGNLWAIEGLSQERVQNVAYQCDF